MTLFERQQKDGRRTVGNATARLSGGTCLNENQGNWRPPQVSIYMHITGQPGVGFGRRPINTDT
jgi:hypothetical protein